MASNAVRYPDILDSWQDRSKLTRAMANAISTGNWNIKRFRIDRAGVSQASGLGCSESFPPGDRLATVQLYLMKAAHATARSMPRLKNGHGTIWTGTVQILIYVLRWVDEP